MKAEGENGGVRADVVVVVAGALVLSALLVWIASGDAVL